MLFWGRICPGKSPLPGGSAFDIMDKTTGARRAPEGGREMGFLNKKPVIRQEGFHPLELNEDNVRAIFERCLAKPDSKKFSYATLFPTTHGYELGAEKQIQFDTVALVENKRSIEYLFGQIQEAHRTKRPNNLTLDDFNTTYLGNYWTDDKGILLRFLYLGQFPCFPSGKQLVW